QVRQALAPGVQVEVAGHGLHLDRAGDAPAQGDVAAHALDVDLAAVEVEAHVAAHRLHAGLARRAHGGDPAAHALDLEGLAGHALAVHGGRHRFFVQAVLVRVLQDQAVGLGAAAVARGAHADVVLAAAFVDLEACDAVAEAAGKADIVDGVERLEINEGRG